MIREMNSGCTAGPGIVSRSEVGRAQIMPMISIVIGEASILRDRLETSWRESAGGGVETRRAADMVVREHRKRRGRHQTAAPARFQTVSQSSRSGSAATI